MNRILIAIILLLLSIAGAFSQNANVGIERFELLDGALRNGKIYYFNPVGDTTFNFRFAMNRNFPGNTKPPIRIKAIAVFENNGSEYPASDSVYLTQGDFTAFNGEVTQFINKTFTLKSQRKEGTLKLKYQFLVDFPGYSGWTNWLYSTTSFQTQRYTPPVPQTTFAGPDQICADGIYTITNPGTITLENANGIATLTALGNNQWKVTRIGEASGKIKLKSELAPNNYRKDIYLGTPPSVVNGPSIIRTNGVFNFSISRTPGASIEYTVMAPTGVELTRIDNTNFSLNVTTPSTNGSTLMVRVTVKTTDSCGTNQYVKFIGVQL